MIIEDAAFMHGFRARSHLTNIQGFSELLADPSLDVPHARRLEYAEIVFASGLALQAEIDAFLALIGVEPASPS